MMRTIVLVMTLPVRWALYFVSGYVPRRKSLVVFGAPKDGFSDNSRYLFLDAVGSGCEAIWISGSAAVVSRIRGMGLKAERRWSAAGLWATLRAATFVISCYASDVNFWTSRGAHVLNLWHGVPLKKIERAVGRGKIARRYDRRWWIRLPFMILAPHVYRRPDRLLVPAPGFTRIFAEAFDVPETKLIVAGAPRNRWLGDDAYAANRPVLSAQDCAALFGIPAIDDGELRVLYAPTWREDEKDFCASSPMDWKLLDNAMSECAARMTVRLHPAARCAQWPRGLKRINLQQGNIDIYALMSTYDCLITDYSSIYFDFLLLDRPIVLFPYDLEKYRSDTRGLYFDYQEMAPGPIAGSQSHLEEILRSVRKDPWAADRKRLIDRLGIHARILRATDCLPCRMNS